MREIVTPKQVARAIQVSESSVKRWCDKGKIPTQYTAGGHRRIPLSGLLEFLRSTRHELVRPEVVGLPAVSGQSAWVIERAMKVFRDAALAGDAEQCRRVVLDLFLAEHRISRICDAVLAPALREVGEMWRRGAAEVYQERRSCEVCLRILRELQLILPAVEPGAPRAMGGAADPYDLATAMVELVLQQCGWEATSLGRDLPIETMAAAIAQHRPRLFWISASHLPDPDDFTRACCELEPLLNRFSTKLVLGGRAVDDDLRDRLPFATCCEDLQTLESIALQELPAPRVKRPPK